MLEYNKSIEYLGLSRNNLDNVDLILEKLKRRLLEDAEVITIKNRQAEKDAIVAKNAK